MQLGGDMHLVITIDTEEDNWSDYDSKPVNSNISKLLELQQLFDRYDVRPTYLVSYPVAAEKESVSILRKIMEDGRCEIGAHIHTWNTPPFEEERTVQNTMLSNLGRELQYRKLESLHEKIFENFRITPVSFRSGRWGFDQTVAENIHRLGYKVDTSVSPYLNWESYHGPDFSARSPQPEMVRVGSGPDPDSCLLEVPATIGFLQGNYEFCNACLKTISGSALRHLRLAGILDRMNIINKVWLSPESDNADKMIGLAGSIMRKGIPVLNMFFHSPSLRHGLTHFTKTIEEAEELTRRIEKFLQYKERENIRSITMSESLNVCLPKTAAS
jgi:hypothetical protein